MASFFNVTLDSTAPAGVSVSINNGAAYCTTTAVTLKVTTSDASTTGYQMKIWGTSAAATEAAASWESFAASKSVALPTGDGAKTVSLKLRDALGNESAAVTDSITLDTAVPVVTVTGPDVSAVSAVAGFCTAAFSFSADSAFTQYKIKAVPASSSLHSAGAAVGTVNGSTNMAGTGSFPANTPIACTINGADLAAASPGDGVKILKVFVLDVAGNWSVA